MFNGSLPHPTAEPIAGYFYFHPYGV